MMLSLALALLAQAAAPPPDRDSLRSFGDPPVPLIDFLGRRWRCAEPGIERGEQARLRCAALGGEERALRARFAGNAEARRWLDQAPRDFRLEMRFVTTFDGPEPVRPRRTEQSGADEQGRLYRLTIDTAANGGRTTRITALYDGRPERSFTLRNRDYPLIDLQTLAVGVLSLGDRGLSVQLRFGHRRGYCGERGDDREEVRIAFGAARTTGYVTRRDNCERRYETIESAAAR